MTTTEQALKAARGAVLPETLADKTGRTVQDTIVDLSMLLVSGKAEEVGGRWKWVGDVDATPKPSRAKAVKGSKKPPVHVKGKPKVGETKRKGKGWTAKQGTGKGTEASYPVKVCSTRYKSSKSGRFVKTPKDAPAPGKARKGKVGGLVLVRGVQEGEVLSAKVINSDMRNAQRRGKLTKAQVREEERNLSDELLAQSNPRLAASIDNDRMRQSHQSDKAKRGAATRKRNAATKKHRPASAIKADHLKATADLAATKAKLGKATAPQARATHQTRIRNLNLKLGRLQKEAKAAGVTL